MFASRSIRFPALVHRKLALLVVLVAAGAFLLTRDAFAIDGNYSSPYASQWDSRNAVARVPDETLLGMLLLVVNFLLATICVLRNRFRRGRQPT